MSRTNFPSIRRVIDEGGTLLLDLTHKDAGGALAAPTSLSYRIDDLTNDREILDWTAVATPASKNTITITATQNTLQDRNEPYEVRQITTRVVDSLGNPDPKAFAYKVNRIFKNAGYLFP